MGSLEILLSHMKTIVATSEATACRTSSISRPRTNCTFCARVTHRPTDLHDMHGTQKQSSRTIATLPGNDPGAPVRGPARPSEAGAGKCLQGRYMQRTWQPRDRLRRTRKGSRGACPVGTNHPRLPSLVSSCELHLGEAAAAFRSCFGTAAYRRNLLHQIDLASSPRRLPRGRRRVEALAGRRQPLRAMAAAPGRGLSGAL